jgi:nicotinamidase/pyrazinamidase
MSEDNNMGKRERMKSTANTQKGMSHKAIMVVDIQEDYTGPCAKEPFPYKDSEHLITLVNTIVEKAAAQDVEVVYITQEFQGIIGKTASKLLFHGTAIQGQAGTQLDTRLKIVSNAHFPKPKPNAFSNPKLATFLKDRQIKELYLVGLDAAFCLDQTAKGAVRLGYTVNVIHDGVVTNFEKRWRRLREQYPKHGITLMSSQALLEMLVAS